jgi:uncharacterized protein
MKKIRWILAAVLCMCFAVPLSVSAAGNTYVVDQADLLSADEEAAVGEVIDSMREEWNQDFVVVTTADAEGKESEAYADDYYDYNGYQKNGVLFLIDLDNGNVWISTSGAMIEFLTDDRIESVIDAGYPQMKDKQYRDGFIAMLEQTETYMKEGIPDNQYTYNRDTGELTYHRSISWLEGLIALLAAVIGGGGFAWKITSSYKMKHSSYSYPYREKANVNFTRKDDRFINQVVTRRRIPKNPPSGGNGSTTHISSSGSSHGGGGRSL